MKRIIALSLCITLVLLTISCSSNLNDHTTDIKQDEITILIKDFDFLDIKTIFKTIYNYSERFEKETGIKVNFDVISGNNADDYYKKMNTKLYLEEGPTLIYISYISTYKEYIDQGIALNAKGKITNFTKVYDSLLDDGNYFVPIGMIHWVAALNRCAFDKLEIDEPKLNWTREDYIKINEKWLKGKLEHFNKWVYIEKVSFLVEDLKILDKSNKKVSLNNSKVIQYINDIREEILFSGKYIINKEYTYENYYNVIFKKDSAEYNASRDLHRSCDNENLRKFWIGKNGLKSLEMTECLNLKDIIVLPNVINFETNQLDTFGFIINKNGKNIDLGMKFINELLSDEIQLEMYLTEKNSLYPVNKDIENEIETIEKEKNSNEKAIALRKYILQQIKNGNYKHNSNSRIIEEVKDMIYKDFAKYIFADKAYTDEELSRELEKLEYKYNMWLNE
ncbi:extracellular solute-binding protein [Abyssisolibacter fermentans]|uniref:extracellular solute-binding protein n=1 Tax=Abyssisolibacter fermentans TaxID=1766203 RepID=UPI00082DDBEA|nr:extracellular solute-binding protein [Abyssisolibacter fermentans]